jgi:hypothetical protein
MRLEEMTELIFNTKLGGVEALAQKLREKFVGQIAISASTSC